MHAVLNVHIYLYKHIQFNGIEKFLPSALSDIINRVSLIGLVIDTILVARWKARNSSKQALTWSLSRCGHSRKYTHYASPCTCGSWILSGGLASLPPPYYLLEHRVYQQAKQRIIFI